MQDDDDPIPSTSKRAAWNKGKLIGAKPPLRPKHVSSIRTKLQVSIGIQSGPRIGIQKGPPFPTF